MGVHNLWELLAPVGRRVSVETLAGKRLAIDASIWMVQFMKAMRDENGEMIRNAHLLGFFRRILKLLFLRTKPVFVFDGGTPALKRRTVAARRRQRDQAQAKIRKTAEKLLLNHVKAKRLEELAEEIKRGSQAAIDAKGKKVVSEDVDTEKKEDRVLNQESFDAMLAASIAAEEARLTGSDGPSSVGNAGHGEEDDEDEEMILPVASGKIDPTVLASLPPSMQLDLIAQMREKRMVDNRQKYQKFKKTPTKFSELQIESYLENVALRRDIDKIHKCAAGKEVEGVRTSRIASEANREFIFSSSFTGDKQMLASRTVESNGEKVNKVPQKPINLDVVKQKLFTSESNRSSDASVDKFISGITHEAETHHRKRRHLRVSRVGGFDIHMTRDLQRNLDMMKEYEQEFGTRDVPDPEAKGDKEDNETERYPRVSTPCSAPIDHGENNRNISESTGILTRERDHLADTGSIENNHSDVLSDMVNKSAIEISFLDIDSGVKDADDNLFLDLVSGSSNSKLCSEDILPGRIAEEFESKCVQEERSVEETIGDQNNDHNKDNHFLSSDINCEDDVEWEEGDSHVPGVVNNSHAEQEKVMSLGFLEEEAAIEEALRRSLEDVEVKKAINASLEISHDDRNYVESPWNVNLKGTTVNTDQKFGKVHERTLFPSATSDEHDKLVYPCRKSSLQTSGSPGNHCPPSIVCESNLDTKASSRVETNDNLFCLSSHTGSTLRTSEATRESVYKDGSKHDATQGPLSTDEIASLETEATEKPSSSVNNGFARTSEVNDAVSEEGSRSHVSSAAPCTSSFAEAREEPILKISREDYGHATFRDTANLPAVDDADASQASLFGGSFVGIDGGGSQKTAVMTDVVANGNLVQEHAIRNDNSVPTVEDEFPKDNTTTEEKLDDSNFALQANFDEEISLLRQERVGLGDERRRLESNAESVSSEMFAECQELLQMFGLPFIIAPMEAEAQCAYLELLNLVDGVVTDDSDVFLFGARNVYKNIFDDRKYVETYFMKDIERELGLYRDTLIRMALLLGSDYTEGVSGIGIVNAIEVVRAFPEEDGLQKFREWIESPDPAIFGKLGNPGNNSNRRLSKSNKRDANATGENAEAAATEETRKEAQSSGDDVQHIKEMFMAKHRNVSKNWHLPSTFPSESVISAYTSPQVDESKEAFAWGRPDLTLLRKLCWESFGWNNKKSDELLVPVLNEYNKHETQLRLEAFYTFNERFAKIRSQRIKKAVKGITGKCSAELMDDSIREGSDSRKKKGSVRAAPEECISEGSASKRKKVDSCEEADECKTESVKGKNSSASKSSQQSGKRKSCNRNTVAESAGAETNILDGGKKRKSGQSADVRGRRGRGRGQGRRRGKARTENVEYESAESSSSEECTTQVPETMSEPRRSKRPKKHVKYAEENMENDAHNSGAASVEQEMVDPVNNIGSQDVHVHPEGVNHDPDVTLSRDYLESGGGFCVEEETEGDALNPSEKEKNVGEGKSSNLETEYLLSGGGFCTNESEAQADTAQLNPSPTKGDLNLTQNTQEPTHDESVVMDSKDRLHSENVEDSGANFGLRAMPLLRRKRRKV